MIDGLIRALALGSELTAEEILDVLWLSAMHVATMDAASDVGRDIEVAGRAADPGGRERAQPVRAGAEAGPPPVAVAEQVSDRLPLRLDGGDSGESGASAERVAASEVGFGSPRPIRDALAVPRALRRFRQVRVPSRRLAVDVDATVTATAEAGGVLLPVFAPRPSERALDLALVVDGAPAMCIWDDTFDEFELLLAQTGAFRSVSRWRLTVRDGYVTIEDPSGTPHPTGRLVDPSGRRVVLVATDASAEFWYSAGVWDAVASWCDAMPTALIQVLPQHYWPGTALGEPYVTARSRRPAAPSSEYERRLAWWAQDPGGVVLPVVAFDPEALAVWAQAAVSGTVWTTGITATPPDPQYAPSVIVAQADPSVLVSDFLSRASEGAERLALVLASATTLSMPLITVLQRLATDTDVPELAEVLSGNLLEDAAGEGGRLFRFVPGTREILQRGVTAIEEWDTYAEVTRYLQDSQHLGGPLRALIPDAGGSVSMNPADEPFAELQEALASRLGLGAADQREAESDRPADERQNLTSASERLSLSPLRKRILAELDDPGVIARRIDVVGDVGTGKTALLQAISEHCADNGLLVLNVTAPRFDTAKDSDLATLDVYSALLAEFSSSVAAFKRKHPESEAAATRAMDSLGQARNPSMLYHLGVNSTSTVTGDKAGESTIIGTLTVGRGAAVELQTLLTILQGEAEKALRGLAEDFTLAFLVDDVHRLDGTPVSEWLRSLLRQLPTRCTVTARRSGGESWRLGQTSADRTIVLRNMSPEEVGAYLQEQGLVFTEEDAQGLFDLTRGHGFAVAAWCDLALNGGVAGFAELMEPVRAEEYDEGFANLIDAVQSAVDQIAADVLGYQIPLFGLFTITDRVTPGLIAMLEGDGGRRPSEEEAARMYRVLASRKAIVMAGPNVDEGLSLPRAISEVAWRQLRETDPVGFSALHSRAELYERGQVDLERELKPGEQELEPFAAWTRFEHASWIQGVERWLNHAQWLDREQFLRMRPSLVKLYLDAFWWWDDYLRSKATSDLGTKLKTVSTRQRDIEWMDALDRFSSHWVSSRDEGELRSDPAEWQSVMDAIAALLNMFDLQRGRIPADLTLRRIYILLCNFYGKALWYAGNGTWEDAEEADEWLEAGFLACQDQPGDERNPNGWIGSWARLRRAEVWARLDQPTAVGYLTGLDQTAIYDEDDELRIVIAMLVGDLWWRGGQYARAIEVYSRAVLLSYAYNGKQEKRRKAPNLYTKSLYASTISRTEEKIRELVQSGDPEVLAGIDAALAEVRLLFKPYWDRVGRRPNPPPELSRFALPVPPPWAGDILKIDSQYFGDLVYLVERRQNVIDEPIDPPPSGTAAGDGIDSGSPSSG